MPLLPLSEAQSRLFVLAPTLPVERIPPAAAAGRWAAEDVVAIRTQPARDLSAMDGYAIRHADLPGPFRCIGESAAGRRFGGEIGKRETVRIFTGAAMPPGADCVLVQEEAARDGDVVHLSGEGPGDPGRNVRRAGLDFSRGETLISKGERLTAARVAVALIGGVSGIAVHRRVNVAIVATGDELARGPLSDADALPESNVAMLSAQLAALPCDVSDLGILPDRLDALTDAFRAVDADILVTTGGASVGDHDLVRPALEMAGATIDFWRIALRPGKPMMAGRMKDTVVVGLPGNPVSAFVTAELYVKPLIAAMSGAAAPMPPLLRVPLGEPLPANGDRTDYLRGALVDGRAFASTIQDSSMLRTLARSTCLIKRDPHAPPAQAGDSAEILVIA